MRQLFPHLRRRSLLWEHLELDFPRVRRHFLIRVAHVLRQRSLEDEISLVPRILPLATLDRPLKVEHHSVNNVRRETQLVPLQLAALEKLIQKRSLVALPITEARNESRDVSRILHRHLHKFALFQKRVHSRILMPTFSVRLRSRCPRRFRLLRSQFQSTQHSEPEHQRENKSEVDSFHDTAQLNRIPSSPPHQTVAPPSRRL